MSFVVHLTGSSRAVQMTRQERSLNGTVTKIIINVVKIQMNAKKCAKILIATATESVTRASASARMGTKEKVATNEKLSTLLW